MTFFSGNSGVRTTESSRNLERAMGIEPTSEAWEASILPLYDARSFLNLAKVRNTRKGRAWREFDFKDTPTRSHYRESSL